MTIVRYLWVNQIGLMFGIFLTWYSTSMCLIVNPCLQMLNLDFILASNRRKSRITEGFTDNFTSYNLVFKFLHLLSHILFTCSFICPYLPNTTTLWTVTLYGFFASDSSFLFIPMWDVIQMNIISLLFCWVWRSYSFIILTNRLIGYIS